VWDDWLRTKIQDLQLPGSAWDIGEKLRGISIRIILVYTLWLMRQSWSKAEPITKRLRLPLATKTIVRDACSLWEVQSQVASEKPSQVTERLDGLNILAIYALYYATDSIRIKEILYTYVSKWSEVKPIITGYDLRDRNLQPGPHFSIILNRLKDAWLDGEISTENEERAMLDKLIDDHFSNKESMEN